MFVMLNLNEVDFMLGLHSKLTSETVQILLSVARDFINRYRCANKPLNFIEYIVNIQSHFQKREEIAIWNNDTL